MTPGRNAEECQDATDAFQGNSIFILMDPSQYHSQMAPYPAARAIY